MRSATGVTVQPSKAARAAAIARSASVALPSATSATISSVAGFSTPIRALDMGSTHGR
jgi:hypothetical protein